MPNFERNLHQKATYWAPNGRDLFNNMTFLSPVTIDVRWEDVSEVYISRLGKEEVSRSRVFSAENVELEGYYYLGISSAADPTLVDNAFEIKAVKRTPDLRNLKTLILAYV